MVDRQEISHPKLTLGGDDMKHPDSETLKALKDKAETDPMKAVDELLERVLAGAGAKSGKLDGPQEAT